MPEILMRKLRLQSRLPAHEGCVNCLDFSNDGSLLLSGSDDKHLQVYEASSGRLQHRIPTLHTANIFACQFIGAKSYISASVDGSVQYHASESGGDGLFKCHIEEVMQLQVDPVQEQLFLSCSDDGTINQYDLRVRTSCNCQGCNLHTLIDVNVAPVDICQGCKEPAVTHSKSSFGTHGNAHRFHYHGMQNKHSVQDMDIDPLRPWLLAAGCSDSIVRVYDRRKLSSPVYHHNQGLQPSALFGHAHNSDDGQEEQLYPSSMNCQGALVYSFSPSHIREARRTKYEDDGWTDVFSQLPQPDIPDGTAKSAFTEVIPYASIYQRNEELGLEPDSQMLLLGISSVKWYNQMLIVSFQNENVYLVKPSAMLLLSVKWYETQGAHFELNKFFDIMNMELSKTGKDPHGDSRTRGNLTEHSHLFDPSPKNDWTRPTLLLPLFRGQFAYEYDRDILGVFSGHLNELTMLKRANPVNFEMNRSKALLPPYIASGSDNGFVYLWSSEKVQVQKDRFCPVMPTYLLKGDSKIVNCSLPSPSGPYLAVSGLDSYVKIFAPIQDYWEPNFNFALQTDKVISGDQVSFGSKRAQSEFARLNQLENALLEVRQEQEASQNIYDGDDYIDAMHQRFPDRLLDGIDPYDIDYDDVANFLAYDTYNEFFNEDFGEYDGEYDYDEDSEESFQ